MNEAHRLYTELVVESNKRTSTGCYVLGTIILDIDGDRERARAVFPNSCRSGAGHKRACSYLNATC
jgi:hypothetical protein